MTGESFYKPSTVLDAMADKRMPGGCEDCGAYQVATQIQCGVYALRVVHDDTCPTYRRIAEQRGGAR